MQYLGQTLRRSRSTSGSVGPIEIVYLYSRYSVKTLEIISIFQYGCAVAPHPKLSTIGVINQAIGLIDQHGYDALSVSAVAHEMEVAPSALYTYCDGLDGLRNLVAIAATNNLIIDVRNAATGAYGDIALNAMGDAYRSFALDHPGQFASTLRPPAVDNDDLNAANTALVDIFALVYAATGFDQARSRLAARTTRSAIHGFLALEHTAGTTPDHSDEYQHLLQALIVGLGQA